MTAPIHKPIPEAIVERFKAYHAQHSGWGNLRLVLANQNIKDCHVKACHEEAITKKDNEGSFLSEILMTMSKSQRIKLSRMVV